MKLLAAFSAFFFISCMAQKSESHELKSIVHAQSNRISARLPVYLLGFGVSEPDEIREFMLSYQSNQKVNIEEARKLILQLSTELLANINSSIQEKKLKRNNLDPSFFYLSIGFDGDYTLFNQAEGEIAHVSLYNDIITYKISKPNMKNFIEVYSEPYEEAYQIVYGDIGT
jgi:hypothetical protein